MRGTESFRVRWLVRDRPFLILITSLGLFLFIGLLFMQDNGVNDGSKAGLPSHGSEWDSIVSTEQLNPTVKLINGTEVIWQIPAEPKGILFLAHGCNGKALNFWDSSPNCPDCVGLPEERLLVLNALARRFAVIAISSVGRCWSLGKERLVVRNIIKWWIKKKKLEQMPLFALGASSGGYFVSVLATELKFSSIVIMIAEGVFNPMDLREDYPPTLFVHMPKDKARYQKVSENIELLRRKGVDAEEVKCTEFPLTPGFLVSRIPGLDYDTCSRLYQFLRDKGFINSYGYMMKDGRQTPWKEALEKSKIYLPYDSRLGHHIEEEMNLAFAYHEMTSLPSDQIFKWFRSHIN